VPHKKTGNGRDQKNKQPKGKRASRRGAPRPKRSEPSTLNLHPEFHRLAGLEPGIHELEALFVRDEPALKRWTENLAINLLSAAIGAVFTAVFLSNPLPAQPEIGAASPTCAVQSAHSLEASIPGSGLDFTGGLFMGRLSQPKCPAPPQKDSAPGPKPFMPEPRRTDRRN